MAIVGMKRFRTEEGGDVGGADEAANVLLLLSRGTGGEGPRYPAGRLFRCKSCGRQFPSFQALGGHRASHKKPRLITGADHHVRAAAPAKPRVAHQCPICGLEFAMGQALGGHMRRHRAAAGAFPLVAVEKKPVDVGGGARRLDLDLDLDLQLSLPSSDEQRDVCALKLGLEFPVVGCLHRAY